MKQMLLPAEKITKPFLLTVNFLICSCLEVPRVPICQEIQFPEHHKTKGFLSLRTSILRQTKMLLPGFEPGSAPYSIASKKFEAL
jgi:hypothetical protein